MQIQKYRVKIFVIAIFIALQTATISLASWADMDVAMLENFDISTKATVLGTWNSPAQSSQNPENTIARIPESSLELVFKPDIYFGSKALSLSAKPRVSVSMTATDVRGRATSDEDSTLEIIEFGVRQGFGDNFFASYGWENIQWGPSFLYSPSNPFYNDNGKKDLVNELPGKGAVTLLYVFDYNFSASLIVNTDKGAFNESGFEKTAAVKIDYTGDEAYASVILSHQEHTRTRLGFFAGTTFSDAVLIYAEASLEKASPALLSKQIQGPLFWEMEALNKDDSDLYPVLLAGMSYTLQSTDTLTVEYLYYGHGYSDAEADLFFTMLNDAASLYTQGPAALSGYGHKLLGQGADNRLDFLRRHYLMLQYVSEDIIEGTDLVGRVTFCLDDLSSRWYTSLSHDLNDMMELKTSVMVNPGPEDASFGRFLDYQIQLALEVHF